MKSNAPWSVKGIERDARETAKAAAQREGMTVGEWLNQIIYNAGDPNAVPTEGEIEGLRARDLASAIEHLSRRIAVAEEKSVAAVDGLSRSLGGAVERLQRLERADPVLGGEPDLAHRVKMLEEKGADRQRIEALRALERAVGQIAVQFSNAQATTVSRLDTTERQLQSIAEKLDVGGSDDAVSASSVREAIEGMADRISRAEKIAAEASKLKAEANESADADFVHKTGLRLRILGDEIKRGGDQMRTLETSITRLTQQIDAAEKRSAEGVQKVAETIADLREKFAGADNADQAAARAELEAAVSEITQRTEDRIEHLQKSFDDMVRRLESASAGVAPAPKPEPVSVFEAFEPEAEAAEGADEIEASDATDAEMDFDRELEDAFAALELEEPIPTPPTRVDEAETPAARAPVETSARDSDDFNFDEDDKSETADVLAEIREAFGIDEPAPKKAVEAAEFDAAPVEEDEADNPEFDDPTTTADADESVEDELPPVVAATAETEEKSNADYLKAARRAAREAAARAAAEEQSGSKRKLSPKQRAILAARIKRRKAQEAEAEREKKASLVADVAPATEADEDDARSKAGSLKARIAAVAAKIKLKAPAKKTDEASFDDTAIDAPKKEESGAPSLLASANGALRKLNIKPTGGVIAVAVAVLLLIAAVFLVKDMFGKPRASAPAPVAAAPQSPVSEPDAAGERFEPTAAIEDTVRPRDLYLENIASLKNATNDADARAALAKIEQAASLGHPPAQLQVGELYKLGQLYDRDLSQARMWFERAANGGNVLAMHRLGVMAARGEGGPVDIASSVSWFEKAATFGLVDSQYNLGATFHPTPEGAAGGFQDRAKAYFWYSIAAKNGDAQAGEMAAGLAATMPEAEKSAKDAEVAAWAAKTPDPAANELATTN
ncbi:MAG: hypothetical protein AB7F91_03895 [Parvularculaceae bacterium]